MACLSWIASAMKPERVKLKKLIDTIIYTPNKYSPGMLIFVLLDLDDNVHLVKLEDEYVHKLSANSFLKLYKEHECYFKTMEKMFHHDRDYVPYDPTPVKVKSPWGDSERMHTPERPLFNMSNLEQRKMFTYLATVPVSEFPKAVFNKYNFSQNDKQIFWAIHSLVEDDKLKIGDILRINRVARLQVSSGSSALFIAITDRKGKVRVFDDRMFSENKVSRRELKDYIEFTYMRSLELASVLWAIARRKHNPAVIDHE
jgi:DNA-binding cell septation regulator SpoVG